MKKLILLLLFIPLVSFGQSYKDVMSISSVDMFKKVMIENEFEYMEGKECELAVKIKDSKYYVVGTGIDDYGDAHSEKGFCNAIRKADIQGEVIDNKFHITYFKLR